MEPIAAQSINNVPWMRPVGGSAPELSVILRQGSVLAGEVLQTLSGGSLLIGVGRHRVPAHTQTQLEPGQRYLFEVLSEGPPAQLRVLADEVGGTSGELLAALRRVLGAEQPLGALLEGLAAVLAKKSSADAAERAALARLAEALDRYLFAPGADGAELALKLRDSGASLEARFAELARRLASDAETAQLAELLRTAFSAELGVDDARGFERELGEALRRLFAGHGAERGPTLERWLAGQQVGALPTGAGDLLEHALAELRTRPGGEALLARLGALNVDAWPRSLRDALLRALVGAPQAERAASAELATQLADLSRDLKSELLRALGELGPGALRGAVERALASVEAEQLLNLARNASSEPLHFSLPILDDQRWGTAHLFVHRDGRRARRQGRGEGCSQRVSVAVEFTRTGPVHVDLLLRERSLSLRVLVARDDVAAQLRALLPALEQHLALGGRTVHTALATVPESQLLAEDGVRDVGYLRDHHVMDLTG